MSSSSDLSSVYHAQNGFGTSSGTLWCMGASYYWDSDPSPWLQMDMEAPLTVMGVKVTGKNSPANENALMYFKISYSSDLQTWTFLKNHTKENNDVKVIYQLYMTNERFEIHPLSAVFNKTIALKKKYTFCQIFYKI